LYRLQSPRAPGDRPRAHPGPALPRPGRPDEKFGLSSSALRRHTKHLAGQLDLQRRRQDQANLTSLLERLDILNSRLYRLFNSAADQRALHVALGAIRESLRLISLQERFRHGLGDRP